MKIGIAGGGLAGSLLAWRAARAGAHVEVFDAGPSRRCSHAAAGMLSPVAELATSAAEVGTLGAQALPLWRRWLEDLREPGLLTTAGSLLVAHDRDLAELDRTARAIAARHPDPAAAIVPLERERLAELEPDLGHLPRAYFLPAEGQIDTDAVLALLHAAASDDGAVWHDDTAVDSVEPGTMVADGRRLEYDWACDCRGLGAAGELPLRAVRGEIVHLECADFSLRRPVRLAHPRQQAYIVPRRGGRLLVGATEIESADPSGVSVRSALELLGAVYSLHAALAEARIVDMRVGLRPALPDNAPAFEASPGKVSINGLYRHGFLAAPPLVERATVAMGLQA